MIIAQIALPVAALLTVAAMIMHFNSERRTRRRGGFYIVPDTPAKPKPLRPALTIIEGGK